MPGGTDELPDRETPAADASGEPAWIVAAQAAESKKGIDVRVLDLSAVSSFTDYFVICSAGNIRQAQAIADEVELRLRKQGAHPLGVEGYERAEWILLDYGDFIVHIFSEAARTFYDLERLWRTARQVEIPAAP